ncbi:MAG: hypothetical protein HN509_13775 [Halobacteriovoraceae bacterium]|jgi:hypothetical protein|nr:hypothetical protein [Halobacteriovoraceae bacterium]MBT5094891.1 hypothetical protein [Halobacteriovoraceae bacterium]
MKTLEIEFCDFETRQKKLVHTWKLLDTAPTKKWLTCLEDNFKKNCPRHTRFAGFIDGPYDQAYLAEKLNSFIDRINREGNHPIKERASEVYDQEFCNAVHHHFEILIGPIWQRNPYYLQASKDYAEAVNGLNHYIHEMESLKRGKENFAKNPDSVFGAICSEFHDSARHSFEPEFYQHFKIDIDFGDLVLHYAQIGKTWWEVYIDQDEDIFPEAILPLQQINGEFDIFFGQVHLSPQQREQFHAWLRQQGQDPADLSLGLGSLKIGTFVRDNSKSIADYQKEMAWHLEISKISVHEGQKTLLEKSYT